jgi:hypothetical protein
MGKFPVPSVLADAAMLVRSFKPTPVSRAAAARADGVPQRH